MTTKTPGGRITGFLSGTFEAQSALNVGDHVSVTGDYEVDLADGSAPVIGQVSVANKGRSDATGFYPVDKVPGDVTVELFGFAVLQAELGETLSAGDKVGVGANNQLVAADGTNDVGVLLVGGDADDPVDYLATSIAPGANPAP